MHAPDYRTLEQGCHKANEAEEAAGVLCFVREEIVRHEWQAELHAAEEENKGKMSSVEEGVGVGSHAWLGCLGLFGLAVRGRSSRRWKGFWQTEVQVNELGHDQEQREAGSHCEGVLVHDVERREVCAQRWTKCEGNTETHANERHCCASLALVADVRRNRHGELHVALAQSSNNATRQECTEVGRCNPKRNAEHIARHGPQQCCSPAISV